MRATEFDLDARSASSTVFSTCRLCRSAGPHRPVIAQELMFGIGGSFEYFECTSCGSLQISSEPTDLRPFYPAHYYSYRGADATNEGDGSIGISSVRRWARSQRSLALCGHSKPTALLLNAISTDYSGVNWTWMRKLNVTPHSRILDVGCGAGDFLRQLRLAGFRHLYGADPFLPCSIVGDGLTIINRDLCEIDGLFDAITFHHSLEHMFDPVAAMIDARRKLAPGGRLLLRLPVAGCRVWHEYGVLWCQLDAPRHLTIPSLEGLRQAAGAAGLQVDSVKFDSYGFQFWGSEIYRRGLPLIDANGMPTLRSTPPPFDAAEMEEFEQRAAALNSSGEGDQACFYLSAA